MDKILSSWPKALFIGTLGVGCFFLIVSYMYLFKLSSFNYDRQLFDQLKADYTQQITELSSRLMIKKTITQTIQEPTIIQQCQTIILNQRICVPVTQMNQRQIQTAVDVPDPDVQKKISDLRSKLDDLSAQAQASHLKIEDFRPFYDFVQNMMRPLISLIVLTASLFIILSKKYASDVQKWAFGSLGTVLGFWLK